MAEEGLLGFLNTPAGMGLLSGIATYATNARRGTPVNNIGRGLAGGLMGYGQAQDAIKQEQENAFMRQFKEAQLAEMQARAAELTRQRDLAAKKQDLFKTLAPKYTKPTYAPYEADNPFNEDLGNLATQAGSQVDLRGLQAAIPSELAQAGFVDEALSMMPKPKAPIKAGPGDVFLDPETGEKKFSVPEKIDYNKPFLPDGTPNPAYQEYATQKARAGAANIVNKIDNKTGESLAGQIGPMAKDSRTRALGAVKMADSAERLESALSSGKVIAGPFASKRLFLNQVGTAMGITGPETVTQTRQVIRALAESSVEARKELQGQGQVTENEAKAVEKAMSGNIDDMTVDELKSLVSLNKKAAKFSVEQHKYLLDEMNKNQGLQGVSKFYDVPGMDRVMKYQFDAAKTGKSNLSPAEQQELEQLRKRFGK